MSELSFKYDETGKGIISAFAYSVGEMIEDIINEESNNATERARLAEAKILDYHQKLEGEAKKKYAEYFGIVVQMEGRIG